MKSEKESHYRNKDVKGLNKLRGLFFQKPMISIGVLGEDISPPRNQWIFTTSLLSTQGIQNAARELSVVETIAVQGFKRFSPFKMIM